MSTISSSRSIAHIGSTVLFLKIRVPIERKLWYTISKKVKILRDSKFFLRKSSVCYFPGLETPTYSYKSFCYLTIGDSRILVLGGIDATSRILFDFRRFATHSDLRVIL